MEPTLEQEVLDAALTLIHTRQNASPKGLIEPGPDRAQIETILGAAGAAPDHRRLNPWRLIVVPQERRQQLGEAFAAALAERDAEATEAQKQEARDKAWRGPFLALAVVRLDPMLGDIPARERIVSAGCALQNMLLVAHAIGFGAGLASGRALYSRQLRELFRLGEHEQPLCFFAAGTVAQSRPAKPRPAISDYTSTL
jgi:nitroreductase